MRFLKTIVTPSLVQTKQMGRGFVAAVYRFDNDYGEELYQFKLFESHGKYGYELVEQGFAPNVKTAEKKAQMVFDDIMSG